jgi:L-lactate dehydrogenase (cytochrome)/(S)-mandelate dehydrogenase
MLPQVRAAVGDGVELILDSGVRRGSDIVIARCLGARSALFGRPTLYGIAAGGQAGAARALAIIRTEVDTVLAQIGCRAFDDLDGAYLETKFRM